MRAIYPSGSAAVSNKFVVNRASGGDTNAGRVRARSSARVRRPPTRRARLDRVRWLTPRATERLEVECAERRHVVSPQHGNQRDRRISSCARSSMSSLERWRRSTRLTTQARDRVHARGPGGALRDLSTRGFFPHIAKYRLFTQIEIALYPPTYFIFDALIARQSIDVIALALNEPQLDPVQLFRQ